MAQVSPLQSIVVRDFDGDGHVDIYAVQNSYAPTSSVGRFDGGLSVLLRGDGRGGFTWIEPAASGLVVPGDAKSVVAWDRTEGGPAILVTRNNDTPLLFHRNSRAQTAVPNAGQTISTVGRQP